MEFLSSVGTPLLRTIVVVAFLFILLAPAWWMAGRILEGTATPATPFFRFLCAIGLALVGYVSCVNLLGRLIGNSIVAVLVYLAVNAAAGILLWRRWPAESSLSPLISTWRSWIAPVSVAILLGVPQWVLAVSTNFFDEAASSAIHLTAANQFSEGVFPPRHNALPDIIIKYHYGFTILSGTVRWLTGLSANVSIDVVGTSLWLFIFLFVYFWLRRIDFGRFAAGWGAFATLLGGGLAWLYLPRIEAYDGIEKVPPPSQMASHYDPAKNWVDNLLAGGRVPSVHLRNFDGSLSNLPWDIAAQFQQHAVSLGIAVVLVALFLFVTWQKRPGFQLPLLAANIVTFSVLILAHSVFGAVAAVTAGICLLISWLRRPTRWRLYQGLCFGAGVAFLALLHGGLLARGPQYGANAVTTFRHGFGYNGGGLAGFINWNLAAFGLPFLLTIVSWSLYLRRRYSRPTASDGPEERSSRKRRRSRANREGLDTLSVPGDERNGLFVALTVFTLVSYLVPHLMFYSSETSGVEQFTEISKFFFCAHLAFALLSAYAIQRLLRSVHWGILAPGFALMSISPLSFLYAGSFSPSHKWVGFYHAPYYRGSIEQQAGETLRRLKKGNREVYFDASADERRHGYLGELLMFGGSVFTLTPSRYERTGIGYRLSEQVVARRLVQNGRMARLLPGAAEDCSCRWYYSRPLDDIARSPLLVRSRFNKLVAEGYFQKRFEGADRVLYSIDKSTSDLDYGIERYWSPKGVSQTRATSAGDGKDGLIFFDLVNRRILAGDEVIEPPQWLLSELPQLYIGKFPGDSKIDFLFGRMRDTEFRLGKKLDEIVEHSWWSWTYRDSRGRDWQPEYQLWLWDWDLPLIADVDHDGLDDHIAYRARTKEWLLAPNQRLNGPTIDDKELPLPMGGRFLEGSAGDLGLWSVRTGMLTLQTLATGRNVSFKWGGRPGDVLVPGDYDGDGYDEVGLWQQSNHTWYWRRAPDGPITQATFGTDTSVPLPADYNHDGRLDLAYWEPREGRIFVSYTRGRSVDLTISVPPHSIPAFVNMY